MKMKARWASYPYIVWMIAFTVIPLCMIVYFAFTDGDGGFTLPFPSSSRYASAGYYFFFDVGGKIHVTFSF